MNDRKIPMRVKIHDLGFNAATFEGERYALIPPARGQYIEIDLPIGTVPYHKIWENNTAYISFIDPEMPEAA